ncbi:MAG: ABC transporter permease [Rubrivivax sp.]|nr:ABC transporter permease [Rubrivivax sp.]NUP86726.1 ABC transporter permease [Burkholderiaceae bacterium]
MLRYTLIRIAQAVPLLAAVVLAVFLMQQLIPGDPVQAMVGDFPVPQAFREAIEQRYRLKDPLHVRIGSYFAHLLQGDLGYSYHAQRPVLDLVLERIPRTVVLVTAGFALAIPLGMLIGVITGTAQRRGVDQAWTTIALVVYAVPTFWLGQLLVLLLALKLPWFPTQGMGPLVSQATGLAWLLERLHYLVLPAAALAIHEGMRVARIMRASVIDTLSQGYVVTARAKGLERGAIIRRHILRNSSLPLITIAGYAIGAALGGAVLLETVFTWPGLGLLLIEAIRARDNMTVMGAVIFSAVAVVLANLVVDVLYALIDPRIRQRR